MMGVWREKRKLPRPRVVERLKSNMETSSMPLYICVDTYVEGILRKKH
jgi:hypothetical protein